MNRVVNISTNSEVVNFIIFKRKLRQHIRRFIMFFIFFIFIFILCVSYHQKDKIIYASGKVFSVIEYAFDQLFAVKINNVRVEPCKNSLLSDSEIDDIKKKFSNKKIDRNRMQKVVETIIETNSLIENIYVRKKLSNEELIVYLKEKQIIGIFYEDCTAGTSDKCRKSIISIDNKLLPYHNIINNDNILKVYGKISAKDIQKVHKILKKYSLLSKTAYINFYSSGRFDITLKNNLTIKLPRQNFEKAIQQFNKLDAEYMLSNDPQSIKYIDLRINDKIFFGQNK